MASHPFPLGDTQKSTPFKEAILVYWRIIQGNTACSQFSIFFKSCSGTLAFRFLKKVAISILTFLNFDLQSTSAGKILVAWMWWKPGEMLQNRPQFCCGSQIFHGKMMWLKVRLLCMFSRKVNFKFSSRLSICVRVTYVLIIFIGFTSFSRNTFSSDSSHTQKCAHHSHSCFRLVPFSENMNELLKKIEMERGNR